MRNDACKAYSRVGRAARHLVDEAQRAALHISYFSMPWWRQVAIDTFVPKKECVVSNTEEFSHGGDILRQKTRRDHDGRLRGVLLSQKR